jgi:Uncharacterised conserved protein
MNDEKTRSFWTISMDVSPTLMAIVEEVDAMLKTYNQPPYYTPPLLHISSIGSLVGDLVEVTNTTTIITINPTANSNHKQQKSTVLRAQTSRMHLWHYEIIQHKAIGVVEY